MFDLTGRVALVTGATKGIGLSVARQLVEHGAKVTITSRSYEDCDRVAAEINQLAGRDAAWPIAFDLADSESVEAMVDAAIAHWGSLDILVANSFMTLAGGAGEIDPKAFTEMFRVNIVQNSMLAHRALPALKQSEHARVTFVGSASGLAPKPSFIAYGLTKTTLHRLAQTLGVEWGKYGIRVNALVPGLTATEVVKKFRSPDEVASMTRQWPIARLADPEEIAAGAIYLSSPAAGYTTASLLICDGGRTQVVPH